MTSIDLPRIPLKPAPKPLSGWTVLAILMAFFATVGGANGIMIHYAISTFPGVEDDKAYEHGLRYNEVIAAAQNQNKLGWNADGRVVRGLGGKATVVITLRDAAGSPVTGAAITGKLQFTPDSRRDIDLALSETAPGEYRTEIKADNGVWLLEIAAARQGEVLYRSRNHLSLR